MKDGAWFLPLEIKEVAVRFATCGNTEEGYIYTIDKDLLESHGVIAHERNYPENSHESEITLRAKDNGDLPMGIIVSKREVKLIYAVSGT